MKNKSTEKRFYVLRAFAGKEKKVEEMLMRDIEQGGTSNGDSRFYGRLFKAVVPVEKVVSQRGTKKIVLEKPYMPGYVLIEAIMSNELREELRSLPDVIGFLGNTNPEPLSSIDVHKLLRKVDQAKDQDSVLEITYAVGEQVRVNEGPFAGFTAVIEEVLEDKRKLKVIVKIFGRKTPLELTYAQVEKE